MAMFAAVTLFSIMGAAVAGSAVSAGASLCLTALGAGVFLGAYALLRRESMRGMPVGLVARIGALALGQAALYFFALRLAPVGPAAALHLAAPVLLLGWALLRGKESLSLRAAGVLLLLVAGLLLAALASGGLQGHQLRASVLLGLGLSLTSAVLLACFLVQVNRHACRIPLIWSNCFRTLASALICLPLLLLDPPTQAGAATMLVVGLLALGPGLALAWYALSRISPQITSVIDLSEAGMTPAISHLAWGTSLTVLHLAAALPILLAVYLQVGPARAPARRDSFRARLRAAFNPIRIAINDA